MSDILRRERLPAMQRWQLQDIATAPAGAADTGRAAEDAGRRSAAELEALQQQAWDEAYARGLEEGRRAGEAANQRLAQQLQSLISAMAAPLEDVDAAVEEELVQLALAVARQVLRRELALTPAHVLAAVRAALEELPANSRAVRVVLHPDDAQLVREMLTMPETRAGWELVEDPVIERGGCQVLSADSAVDASLDARIRAVAARILGGDRDSDAASPDDGGPTAP